MSVSPRGADPTSIRRWNEVAVVRALHNGGPQRISALRQATGITPGPLGQLLRGLEDKNWVTSTRADASGPGRPAQIFRFRQPTGWLLGVEVLPDRQRVVRCDTDGEVHARLELPHPADVPLGDACTNLVEGIATILPADGFASVWAAVFAIDADIDEKGRVLHSFAVPSMIGARPEEVLADRIPVPMASIGRMPALLAAETRRAHGGRERCVMSIDMGERIEVGVLCGRKVSRGHHRVPAAIPLPTAAEIARLTREARTGDPSACIAIRESIAHYVDSIAMAISLVEPARVVVSGPHATVPEVLLPYLRDELERRLRAVPELRVASLDEFGAAMGAALYARQWVERILLSPETGALEVTRENFRARVRTAQG